MKKLFCLILALALLCTLFVGCSPEQEDGTTTGTPSTGDPVPDDPEPTATGDGDDEGEDVMCKDLTALELVYLMGNGTNLGNTMEACDTNIGSKYSYEPTYYETCWGQPVTTQEMILGMKAAGFDTLRIPVAWMTNATTLATDGDYTIAPEYLDRVQEIVDWAIEAGMFVILNDHWDGGWWGMFGSETEATRDLAMEAYIGMWTQIGRRFADYDYHLIFEGANEELGARFDENSIYCSDSITSYLSVDEEYALCNLVNQTFVDTIRGLGGNNATRFLLIPGYGTNIGNTCDDRFVMPTDTVENRLLISVHYYDPWSYCGDGQSTVNWGTKTDIQNMQNTLSQMQKFTDAGYGVVIGEYGVLYATEVQKNTALYHECFLSLCDMYNYTSCLWDCSAFFKRSELKMVEELAEYYLKHCLAAHEQLILEPSEDQILGRRRFNNALNGAVESFREDAVEITDQTALAWIMWQSGDWNNQYSVGDTYNADSISAGLKDTVVVIEEAGTYTVALDFTETAMGYSANMAFSALGITNGELLFPGWCIEIRQILINGESYTWHGKPYTCADDGICTRVNLYNGYINAPNNEARTLDGDVTGCTPQIFDLNDKELATIYTIEIIFYYGPAEN